MHLAVEKRKPRQGMENPAGVRRSSSASRQATIGTAATRRDIGWTPLRVWIFQIKCSPDDDACCLTVPPAETSPAAFGASNALAALSDTSLRGGVRMRSHSGNKAAPLAVLLTRDGRYQSTAKSRLYRYDRRRMS
jgi:hypothetical protein